MSENEHPCIACFPVFIYVVEQMGYTWLNPISNTLMEAKDALETSSCSNLKVRLKVGFVCERTRYSLKSGRRKSRHAILKRIKDTVLVSSVN